MEIENFPTHRSWRSCPRCLEEPHREVKTEYRQRNSVIKNGVRLLKAQKPLKRPGWWKGKVALFWMSAMEG